MFLQYWPVLCKVRGNLSERVFLLELGFAMINIFNYNHKIKQFNNIANYNTVVVKVVDEKFYLNRKHWQSVTK